MSVSTLTTLSALDFPLDENTRQLREVVRRFAQKEIAP